MAEDSLKEKRCLQESEIYSIILSLNYFDLSFGQAIE